MKAFLMRLWGSPPVKGAEQERFEENLKKLEDSEKDLERLEQALDNVDMVVKSKTKTLSTSTIDFSQTLGRSLTPPQMEAIDEAKERDKQDNEHKTERPSGELTPSGATG